LLIDLVMLAADIANSNAGEDGELTFLNDDAAITSYTFGEQQDCMLTVTPDDVTLTSTSEPRKTVVFTANRWTYFVDLTAKIDETAKSSTVRHVRWRFASTSAMATTSRSSAVSFVSTSVNSTFRAVFAAIKFARVNPESLSDLTNGTN